MSSLHAIGAGGAAPDCCVPVPPIAFTPAKQPGNIEGVLRGDRDSYEDGRRQGAGQRINQTGYHNPEPGLLVLNR